MRNFFVCNICRFRCPVDEIGSAVMSEHLRNEHPAEVNGVQLGREHRAMNCHDPACRKCPTRIPGCGRRRCPKCNPVPVAEAGRPKKGLTS